MSEAGIAPASPALRNCTRRCLLLTAGAGILGLSACAGGEKAALVPPEVRLVDLGIARAGVLEQELDAELRIVNMADAPLHVRGLRFTLELDGQKLARGVSDARLTVPPLGSERVHAKLFVPTGALLQRLLEVAQSGALRYGLRGEVLLARGFGATATLPFSTHDELRLPAGMISG